MVCFPLTFAGVLQVTRALWCQWVCGKIFGEGNCGGFVGEIGRYLPGSFCREWLVFSLPGGSMVLVHALTRSEEAGILTPVNYAPARVKRSSMMSARNTFFLIVGSCVFIVVAWTANPMVWRVERLFPSATVTDLYDYPVPAFLHPYVKFSDDLYEGRYLKIEISD
jgi:hypothetical protein